MMKTTHTSSSSLPLTADDSIESESGPPEGRQDSAYKLPFDNLRGSLESHLSRFISQGQNADSRIGMILSTNITMMGALVAVLSNSDFFNLGSGAWVSSSLAFLLGTCSIAFVAFGSFPRGGIGKTSVSSKNADLPGTVLFFSSAAAMQEKEHQLIFKSMEEDEFLDDLVRQCHYVAKIVDLKFRALRLALLCLILGILPWMLAIFYAIHPQ